MSFITYVRPWPTIPPCKHCGETMEYWVPGLSFHEHAHDECRIKAFTRKEMKSLSRALSGIKVCK